MKDRLVDFLRAENKSSAQFAEEIGVQPSGISHILSGRNNPSLDFVLKMLDRYKNLSSDWLLFGKGSMYKESGQMPGFFEQTLFDQPGTVTKSSEQKDFKPKETPVLSSAPSAQNNEEKRIRHGEVEKIVWFYSDGSFEEYYPRS